MKNLRTALQLSIVLIVTMSFLFLPARAVVATSYTYDWGTHAVWPGAMYSERQSQYHNDGWHSESASGIENVNDGILSTVNTVSAEDIWMISGTYTRSYFYWDSTPPGHEWAITAAPDNATINWINATVHFSVVSGYVPSTTHLSYSVNGGTTWISNGAGALTTDTSWYPYIIKRWNITSQQAWSPALVKSPNTQVMVWFTGSAGTQYDIDYVGLDYRWVTSDSPGYPPNGTYVPSVPWPAPDYSPANFTTLMGFAGLFGLVATVPFGIWMARERDEKMIPFMVVLVLGAFFLAMMLQGFG